MDCAGFIKARLDDDEHYITVVPAAGIRNAEGIEPETDGPMAAFIRGMLGDPEMGALLEQWTDAGVPVPNDFERLRRDVVAKRAILALHAISVEHERVRDDGGEWVTVAEVSCYWCGWASDVDSSACATLRHLAAVWSDHSDYRAEWAPETAQVS